MYLTFHLVHYNITTLKTRRFHIFFTWFIVFASSCFLFQNFINPTYWQGIEPNYLHPSFETYTIGRKIRIPFKIDDYDGNRRFFGQAINACNLGLFPAKVHHWAHFQSSWRLCDRVLKQEWRYISFYFVLICGEFTLYTFWLIYYVMLSYHSFADYGHIKQYYILRIHWIVWSKS